MAPRPLPKLAVTLPSPHTLQQHPAAAPSNGTTSTAPCNGTLVPRPIRQSGSSPFPLIGSKNPYSYRYLGNYFNSWGGSKQFQKTIQVSLQKKSTLQNGFFPRLLPGKLA